jgi:hypothetical protein
MRVSTADLTTSPHPDHRIRQATRTFLTALLAWSGERYGIDPLYLGVLLLASFQLGMQRLLGR